MKNNIIKITVMALTLVVTACYSQKPETQIASHIPPEESKKRSNSTLVWSNATEFIVSDRAKDGSVFTVYNGKTMRKSSTFNLDYPEIDGREADWVKRLFHEDKITSLYGYYNKKEDVVRVYGTIRDRKNKSIRKETVLMESYARKRKNIGTLSTIVSNDKSKVLVFREPDGKKYEDEKMEMVLYDNDLKKIWSKDLSFPYKNKSINMQEILVTNEGQVSIIAFWSPTKEEVRENPTLKDQIVFKLFGVTENNDDLEEIEITEGGKALSSCKGVIIDDLSNTIVFSGFYRDDKIKKKNNYSVNGIYYIKLNTSSWTMDIIKFNIIKEKTLTEILIGSSTSERAAERAQKAVDQGYGIYNLQLKGIYFYPDGSIKMISQIEYVIERCTTNPKTGATTCSYYYHNNQIVEFNLSGKGELNNTHIVLKMQVMVNTERFNGHIMLTGSSETYYLFNDNDGNYNPKKLAKRNNNNFFYGFNGSKKSRLCYVYFDGKGKAVKVPMVDHWKQNIFIYPNEYVSLNDKTIVTWGKIRKGKELVLFKIYIDE